jgi:prolyl 4-hydroxylase
MVKEIKGFLSKKECQALVEMIEANNVRSSVVVGGTDRSGVSETRTSSTSNLSPNDETVKFIHQKIADNLGLDIKKGEDLQGQKYQVGQYFKEHNDYFIGDAYDKHCLSSGNRTFTFMIYLNDDFDGGGTSFPKLGKIIKPELGKAVVWQNTINGEPQPETMHEGTTITKGIKYIITSWWRENDWNGAEDANLFEKLNKPKVYTSKEQIPKLTEKGFKIVKVPAESWGLIKDAYEILKNKKTEEVFEGKENVIIGGGSDIYSFEHLTSIRSLIHKQLQPIHEEFCGAKIEPSFIYGIRSYKKGATLIKHVDRVETHHISSIIIVDKDLRCGCSHKEFGEDWPLDIQDHNGEWHKVYAEPGEMILYESAICEHGRTEPFQGESFNNFYVHYKLI